MIPITYPRGNDSNIAVSPNATAGTTYLTNRQFCRHSWWGETSCEDQCCRRPVEGWTAMTELVRFRVREKGTVVFEVEEPTAGIGEVSGVRRVREAKAAFEDHLAGVRDAAASALQIMREAGPDEVKIGFGVTFTL